MESLISDKKTPTRIPALLSLLLIVQIGLLASSLFSWQVLVRHIAKPQVYMQTSAGDIQYLEPVDPRRKRPEVIQAFTIRALMLLFNWPGPQANIYGQMEPDEGITVDLGDNSTAQVPSQVATASFLIVPELQPAILKRISEVIPTSYFGGSIEVLLVLDEVTMPTETVIPGQYEVTVVGHRHVVRDGKLPGQRTPFNKVITLQEVPMPLLPVGVTPLERKVYGVRQAGFLIANIRDVSLEDN